MTITPCENPFAYDPPVKKHRSRNRPNNDIKSILVNFMNSDVDCVHIDADDYYSLSSCEHTIRDSITRHGFENKLGANMVNGRIVLFKLANSDPRKIEQNHHHSRRHKMNNI